MTKQLFILTVSLTLTVLSLSTCKKERICSIEKDGVIAWTDSPQVDGCDWVISIDNESYHPDNLPDDFKIDSLNVKIKYRVKSKKHDYLCSETGVLKTIDIKNISKK